MTVLIALLKCLPFVFLFGMGLNLLLMCLVPSWRPPDWTHWSISAGTTDDVSNPSSWWVKSGWVKARKPLEEGNMDEDTAKWLHLCLGSFLVSIGIAGMVWIAVS